MPARAPVHGNATLILTITRQGTVGKDLQTFYALRYVDSVPEIGKPAWRLTKPDGEFFDVILNEHGAQCTCPDFVWRREHRDPKGCKHIAALRSVGLLKNE